MSIHCISAARVAAIVCGFILAAACDLRPTPGDYEAYQIALKAEGDLRTETAPADAPYDAADLVRNFERIALHHEADINEPGSEKNWAGNPLTRWEKPVRWRIFGAAATKADRAEVRRLMGRIAALTGLEITEAGIDVNFLILITRPGERARFARMLAEMHPAFAETFKLWRHNPELVCVANDLYSTQDSDRIAKGLVVIGSEVRGLMRQSCLHEEIVQAFGLANDHPDVRPSIFNDDEEFALLTEHDEHLLQILYDPRLRPGMTASQAMPIVRNIVDGMDLAPSSTRMAMGSRKQP